MSLELHLDSYLSVVLDDVQWAAGVQPQRSDQTSINLFNLFSKDKSLTLAIAHELAASTDELAELLCVNDNLSVIHLKKAGLL